MSRIRWWLALPGVLLMVVGLVLAHRDATAARSAALRVPPPAAGVLPSVTELPDLADPSDLADQATSRRVGVADGPVSLRYTFDGGIHQPITDVSGEHELRPLGQNGGALRLVPQGVGLAVAYPDRCTLERESDCPRAILEGLRDDSLNPGTRPMEYGASVLMTRGDVADGANVLQKGYSVGGVSQYKLQVDHRLGHPSCVLVGRLGGIYRAEPWLSVADGRWHDLKCVRVGDRLTLHVDGAERAWVRVPPRLSIANAEPLRVGGKGPARGNDQFAGEIDNVFISIGGVDG
ncbi:LamG domain-containing protein [Paractinoplanes durhamensis]|nr:LamG domain-containing protein [Actinoplanes durhamensis]